MSDPKVAYIFKAIENTKMSFTDFSRITKISRETLYRWKKGAPITDMLRLNIAYVTASNMEKARSAGRLPLKSKFKAPQRVIVLIEILADMTAK